MNIPLKEDNIMMSRRNFLNASAMSAVTVAAVSGRAQAAAIPEVRP